MLHVAAQFCENCQSILQVNEVCDRCGHRNALLPRKVVIEKSYQGAQNWTQKALKVKQASMDVRCPKCNAKRLYYSSRQMRSADEGETVFLECKRCDFKSTDQ